MSGNTVVSALLVAMAVGASGCALQLDTTTLGVPVTMAEPAGPPRAGSEFRVSTKSVHGLFGLLSISTPSLQEILATQLVGGGGVARLRIKSRARWSDVLFSVITLGLITPRTVTFEGIVVPPQ